MKKKLLAIVVAACAACMAFALVGCGSNSSSSDSKSSKELRFVTGGESGTYYAYGSVLAQYATNNAGVTVNALSSEGSKANIQSLESNEAELAFCQTDVATSSTVQHTRTSPLLQLCTPSRFRSLPATLTSSPLPT